MKKQDTYTAYRFENQVRGKHELVDSFTSPNLKEMIAEGIRPFQRHISAETCQQADNALHFLGAWHEGKGPAVFIVQTGLTVHSWVVGPFATAKSAQEWLTSPYQGGAGTVDQAEFETAVSPQTVLAPLGLPDARLMFWCKQKVYAAHRGELKRIPRRDYFPLAEQVEGYWAELQREDRANEDLMTSHSESLLTRPEWEFVARSTDLDHLMKVSYSMRYTR